MENCVARSLSFQIAAHLERITEQIEQDSDFAQWLVTEYKPIAGGWQY